MELLEFVNDWNMKYPRFSFGLQMIPVVNKPASVEIRYSAAKYQDRLRIPTYEQLCRLVEANSHGTMYVATNLQLFERGIVTIQIASQNHNYSDRVAKGTLRRVAEEVFGGKWE